MNQQGDVLLFQTIEDGEINVTGGIVETSSGLETSAYLSLFGGNEDDNGLENNDKTWWANLNENEKDKKFVSETQNLLKSLPATSGNLRRIEDAAKRDLDWMSPAIEVLATIPQLNRVKLAITIGENQMEFIENWSANK